MKACKGGETLAGYVSAALLWQRDREDDRERERKKNYGGGREVSVFLQKKPAVPRQKKFLRENPFKCSRSKGRDGDQFGVDILSGKAVRPRM